MLITKNSASPNHQNVKDGASWYFQLSQNYKLFNPDRRQNQATCWKMQNSSTSSNQQSPYKAGRLYNTCCRLYETDVSFYLIPLY